MAHRRRLEFGVSATPYAEAYPQIGEQVPAAEGGGFGLVGIQDHPYQRRFLDTFSLIADLLARTDRLRFFPDVASLPIRPPPMLANAPGLPRPAEAPADDARQGGRVARRHERRPLRAGPWRRQLLGRRRWDGRSAS